MIYYAAILIHKETSDNRSINLRNFECFNMTILKDDGTWEPIPSGYTSGDKDAWRDRMYALCPNPIAGQIVETHSMDGTRIGYKALDANGYDTRWQRVTSKEFDFKAAQEEYEQMVNWIKKDEDEYLYRIFPNPIAGELVITTMHRPWSCNEYEKTVFRYTENGWEEMEEGRYLTVVTAKIGHHDRKYSPDEESKH